MKKFITNGALVAGAIAIVIVSMMGLDRLLGMFEGTSADDVGIIFPPDSVATYSTLEFECSVRINNLGFRDHDATLEKSHATRVIALGDSFTYGWAANIEDIWVKELERLLRAGGRDIEVLNLGVPGYSPRQYADTADEAVPLLKPDVVMVGILQGDDLRQTDANIERTSGAGSRSGTAVAGMLERLYPNLVERVTRRRVETLSGLRDRSESRWRFFNGVWEQQARSLVASLDDARKSMFRSWPEPVRVAFREGRLNPSLLTLDLVWGEPDPDELNVRSTVMQERISRCAAELIRIKSVAETHGARVIVVSIPALEYTARSVWSEMAGLDPEVQQRMLATGAPDDAIREACDRAGVECVSVTEAFRALTDPAGLFYPYDLHFTPRGHKEFAGVLAPHLSAL